MTGEIIRVISVCAAAMTMAAGCSAETSSAGNSSKSERDITGRAENAPLELEQFSFLLGCFRLETYMRDEAGVSWVHAGEGVWRGRWALDGWAIYDEWADIPFPGWAEHLGSGANTRIYDPDGQRFVISWIHSNVPHTRDRRARKVGDQIVVWQPSPEFDDFNWEARFKVGEGGRWSRTDITSPLDDAENFSEIRRIDAFPAPCW